MNSAFVNTSSFAVRPATNLSFSSFTTSAKSTKTVSAAPVRRVSVTAMKKSMDDVDLPKIPQGFTGFSEQLNGRVAMMGLMLGIATEVITGRGMLGQLQSIFEIWSLASTLGN